jgi:hypothetical protein
MINRDVDILSFEATSEFAQGSLRLASEMYPLINAGDLTRMSPQQERVRQYLAGEITHVALSITETTFQQLAIRKIMAEAIGRAADADNPAFCSHGNKHETFYVTALRLIQDLLKQPDKVTSTLAPRGLNIGSAELDSSCNRLVVTGAELNITTQNPLYILVAEHLRNFCETQRVQNDRDAEVKIRRVIAKIAELNGISFAALTAISAGIKPDELSKMFELAHSSKKLNKKRDGQLLHALHKLLLKDGEHFSFSQEKQQEAIKRVQAHRPWQTTAGSLEENAWRTVGVKRTSTPLAVFGSFQHELAQIVNNNFPQFENPAKQKFLDQYANYFTTRIVTMYLTYVLNEQWCNLSDPHSLRALLLHE